MGFLDNSGDIILDAVLTDTGRMRLAKGDGSFRVTKFALADDEIDYSLFNRNHPSGSAYYDLEILQTPILEAFTNNGSSMKNKLLTVTRNNLLHLPVLKINNIEKETAIAQLVQNGYILAVDKDTEDFLDPADTTSAPKYSSTSLAGKGIIRGARLNGDYIRIDQGIDNEKVPPSITLDPDLIETQYIIEMDNRLMSLTDKNGQNFQVPSYIDDDDIASYYLNKQGDTDAFITSNTNKDKDSNEVIAGSRGTILRLSLRASLETSTSDYLFNQFGSSITFTDKNGNAISSSFRSILTSINITGVTTGFGIDIPIRLIKKIS